MGQTGTEPYILGWRERVALPDWGVPPLRAKVDSGARTSALDVLAIEELPDDRVRFWVALSRRHRTPERAIVVVAPIHRRARVRSAHGTVQERFFVVTRVQIGPIAREIELSLVSREQMLCRMLIGRSALADRSAPSAPSALLVDSSRTYRLTPPPTRGRKRRKPAPEG